MSKDTDFRKALRVDPGSRLDLSKIDPEDDYGWEKEDGEAATAELLDQLTNLQDRIWAEAEHPILIVLQGIDAAGKDGTIRKVMTAFNPQGCVVSSFKVPTPEEMAHDFLWRIHKRVPGKGEIGIFNRSHYEDVLVVRVHDLVPRDVWKNRYELIREFEENLVESGTTIIKFFLYISKDEQRQRFQERYDDPVKRWKFSVGDIEEREHWDDYIAAFEDALSETSTKDAPWYVIPANRNWLRNLAVASILTDTLDDLKPAYPAPDDLPADFKIE